MCKGTITLSDVERTLQTFARVAIDNEKYFCDLDGELGDADFGKSLATGFRAILAELDNIDRSDIGTFLTKVGMIFVSTVGGTSGPVWGTGFMRAGMSSKGKNSLTLADLGAMGRNAVQGIMARGGASQGDKTVLDAIIPAVAKIDEFSESNATDLLGAFRAASEAATAAVEETRQWCAKRGRQSYAAERTIGTLDPGIVAIAMMSQALVAQMEFAVTGAEAPT
jgi:phosphoenolpyruvate---glycerone phosphotransferase subunit DhaL